MPVSKSYVLFLFLMVLFSDAGAQITNAAARSTVQAVPDGSFSYGGSSENITQISSDKSNGNFESTSLKVLSGQFDRTTATSEEVDNAGISDSSQTDNSTENQEGEDISIRPINPSGSGGYENETKEATSESQYLINDPTTSGYFIGFAGEQPATESVHNDELERSLFEEDLDSLEDTTEGTEDVEHTYRSIFVSDLLDNITKILTPSNMSENNNHFDHPSTSSIEIEKTINPTVDYKNGLVDGIDTIEHQSSTDINNPSTEQIISLNVSAINQETTADSTIKQMTDSGSTEVDLSSTLIGDIQVNADDTQIKTEFVLPIIRVFNSTEGVTMNSVINDEFATNLDANRSFEGSVEQPPLETNIGQNFTRNNNKDNGSVLIPEDVTKAFTNGDFSGTPIGERDELIEGDTDGDTTKNYSQTYVNEDSEETATKSFQDKKSTEEYHSSVTYTTQQYDTEKRFENTTPWSEVTVTNIENVNSSEDNNTITISKNMSIEQSHEKDEINGQIGIERSTTETPTINKNQKQIEFELNDEITTVKSTRFIDVTTYHKDNKPTTTSYYESGSSSTIPVESISQEIETNEDNIFSTDGGISVFKTDIHTFPTSIEALNSDLSQPTGTTEIDVFLTTNKHKIEEITTETLKLTNEDNTFETEAEKYNIVVPTFAETTEDDKNKSTSSINAVNTPENIFESDDSEGTTHFITQEKFEGSESQSSGISQENTILQKSDEKNGPTPFTRLSNVTSMISNEESSESENIKEKIATNTEKYNTISSALVSLDAASNDDHIKFLVIKEEPTENIFKIYSSTSYSTEQGTAQVDESQSSEKNLENTTEINLTYDESESTIHPNRKSDDINTKGTVTNTVKYTTALPILTTLDDTTVPPILTKLEDTTVFPTPSTLEYTTMKHILKYGNEGTTLFLGVSEETVSRKQERFENNEDQLFGTIDGNGTKNTSFSEENQDTTPHNGRSEEDLKELTTNIVTVSPTSTMLSESNNNWSSINEGHNTANHSLQFHGSEDNSKTGNEETDINDTGESNELVTNTESEMSNINEEIEGTFHFNQTTAYLQPKTDINTENTFMTTKPKDTSQDDDKKTEINSKLNEATDQETFVRQATTEIYTKSIESNTYTERSGEETTVTSTETTGNSIFYLMATEKIKDFKDEAKMLASNIITDVNNARIIVAHNISDSIESSSEIYPTSATAHLNEEFLTSLNGKSDSHSSDENAEFNKSVTENEKNSITQLNAAMVQENQPIVVSEGYTTESTKFIESDNTFDETSIKEGPIGSVETTESTKFDLIATEMINDFKEEVNKLAIETIIELNNRKTTAEHDRSNFTQIYVTTTSGYSNELLISSTGKSDTEPNSTKEHEKTSTIKIVPAGDTDSSDTFVNENDIVTTVKFVDIILPTPTDQRSESEDELTEETMSTQASFKETMNEYPVEDEYASDSLDPSKNKKISNTNHSEEAKVNMISPSLEEGNAVYVIGTVFDNTANFSVNVKVEDSSFYVPANAQIKLDLDNFQFNITWFSSRRLPNGSISFTLTNTTDFYIIKGAQLNILRGSQRMVWEKDIVLSPENHTKENSGFSIEFEDEVRMSISNLDFLARDHENEDFMANDLGQISSGTKMAQTDIEIAVGSLCGALFICAIVYIIIKRTRKRTLSLNSAMKHDIPV